MADNNKVVQYVAKPRQTQPVAPASTPDMTLPQAAAGARYEGASQQYANEAWIKGTYYAPAARYTGMASLAAAKQAEQENQSVFSRIMDNITPDDLGSVGVGPVNFANLGKGYTFATQKLSTGASMGLSALPGGVQTYSWDDASRISPGRTWQAMGVQTYGNDKSAYYRYLESKRAEYADYKRRFAAGDMDALMHPVMNPDDQAFGNEAPLVVPIGWDVRNPEDEKWLFEQGAQAGKASLMSGATDALFSWFLDPLVVGGKAIKIARFGSEAFGVAGLTHRSTNIPGVVESIGFEADDAMKHWTSQGAEGTNNALYGWAENIANRPGHELANEEWAQGPNKDFLLGVADQIHDVPTAITFLAAGTGNSKYIKKLQDDAASVHDALATQANRVKGFDPYEYAALNSPIGWAKPPILSDMLEAGRSGEAILDDLIKRDSALRDAVNLMESSYSPITSVGSKYITGRGQRIAQAWRAGKANAPYKGLNGPATRPVNDPEDMAALTADVNAKVAATARSNATPWNPSPVGQYSEGYVTRVVDQYVPNRSGNALGSVPSTFEKVYQMGQGYRSVRLVDWISGQRGSGWIEIRGTGAGNSGEELTAALSDSKAIRGSKGWLESVQTLWRNEAGPQDRFRNLNQIEEEAIGVIADYYGVSRSVALAAHKAVAKKRDDMIQAFRTRGPGGRAFGIDPQDGNVIFLTPMMRSQLETHVPMVDFRLMDSTIKRLAKPENRSTLAEIEAILLKQSGHSPADFAETTTKMSQGAMWVLEGFNSAWKAATLLRLGYTQRNVLEGWLRTAAVLGTIPALRPSNVATGALNVAWANPRSKRLARSIFTKQKKLAELTEDYRFAGATLEDDVQAFIRATGGMPNGTLHPQLAAHLRDMRDQQTLIQTEIDGLTAQIERLSAKRAKLGKRSIGSVDGAYAGELGDMRRAQASALVNQQNFLESKARRDADLLRLNSEKYRKVQPTEEQYFDELEQAAVQMRNDPLARMALEGASVADMMDFYVTNAGREYVQTMGLKSLNKRAARAVDLHDMVHDYFPTPRSRELAAGKNPATAADLRGELGGRPDLNAIHGREVDNTVKGINPYKFFIETAFKWLGTMPESALVRQPFYDEVWRREGASLYQKAKSQGLDVTDEALLKRIQETAHRRALKQTNDTLFTIVRYSNPAAALRFLSPFFAAWENSMRTWTRIIVKDPSVAARAAILWSLPNRLGMVVDKDGNKVEGDSLSFLTGSENQYIILPQPLQKLFMSKSGGMPFKIPKGAFNVVSPGETPFLPGFGPLVTMPVGMVLQDKPVMQETLRWALGDKVYNQFAPFGQASGDPWDTLATPWMRKLQQVLQGEDNQDYLAVLDAVTVDALVEWRLSGGQTRDMPTAEELKARADDFYKFSILASLTSPVAITRMSAYQPQMDYWRQLAADPNKSYRDKVALFNQKWGTDAYLPLISSTSKSAISNLDPTRAMFDAMTEHSRQVEYLSRDLGDDAPSILAATVSDDQFSGPIYAYWRSAQQPGTNKTYKGKMMPQDIINQNAIQSMWSEYYAERDKRDEGLAALGVKSITAKAAKDAGIDKMWADFQTSMAKKYDWVWDRYGPHPGNIQSQMPKNLTAIKRLLRDEQFVQSDLGQSPVWQSIKVYMDERKEALDAIAQGADKEFVTNMFLEFSQAHKWSSLKFADFWDQYLADDDLTVKVA